jgi:hypothetical protein
MQWTTPPRSWLGYLGHEVSSAVETDGGAQPARTTHTPKVALAVGEAFEVSWPLDSIWLSPGEDTA